MEKKENLQTLNINSTLYKTRLSRKFMERKPFQPSEPGKVKSFIPGTVLDIFVVEGQIVRQGDELLILEAMKMQNRIKSAVEGKVISVAVKKGEKVAKGVLLVEIG